MIEGSSPAAKDRQSRVLAGDSGGLRVAQAAIPAPGRVPGRRSTVYFRRSGRGRAGRSHRSGGHSWVQRRRRQSDGGLGTGGWNTARRSASVAVHGAGSVGFRECRRRACCSLCVGQDASGASLVCTRLRCPGATLLCLSRFGFCSDDRPDSRLLNMAGVFALSDEPLPSDALAHAGQPAQVRDQE